MKKNARNKKNPLLFRMLMFLFIGLVLLLTAGIIILDQRAVEHGKLGLWESITAKPPVTTPDAVETLIKEMMKDLANDGSAALIQEGQTKGREDEILKYKIYRIRTIEIWNAIVGQFELNCENEGVHVHNRFISQSPTAAEYFVFVGTRGIRTHRILFKCDKPTPGTQESDETTLPIDQSTQPDLAHPKISLVFDDFGSDPDIADRFLRELSVPLTLAVIPNQLHSNDIIQKVLRNDQTVLLHMPMEPDSEEVKPGSYSAYLTTAMTPESIRDVLEQTLLTHPGVQGMNNHMGSKLTSDISRMRAIMTTLKQNDLFFLDSRTTAQTVAEQAAKEVGIRYGARSVFLDQGYKGGDVRANFAKLLDVSREKGEAIGIGHAIPATLDAMKSVIDDVRTSGISIVELSTLMRRE